MQKSKEGIKEIQVNHLLELNILEAIILPIEEKNMESAGKAMVQPLLEEDFVTEEYLQSVLEREEMSSTSLNHIALPHGNPAMVQNTRPVSYTHLSLILTLVYQFYPGLSMHEFDKNNRFFASFLGIVNK